jgi:hypothetical protein
VLCFSLQILSETVLILRRNERDMIKICIGLRYSNLYSRLILMKLEFSRQIFEKTSKIKFHENRSSGSRVVHVDRRTDEQMDRHDEANSRFSQFRDRA